MNEKINIFFDGYEVPMRLRNNESFNCESIYVEMKNNFKK